MVFSDIFVLCNCVSRKIWKLYGAKIRISFLLFFSFIEIWLGDRKFSFADIEIINFHNFLFVAVQNFNLGFLQKSKIFWLGILGFFIVGFVGVESFY